MKSTIPHSQKRQREPSPIPAKDGQKTIKAKKSGASLSDSDDSEGHSRATQQPKDLEEEPNESLVPLDKVQTLAEMGKHAPFLIQRLEQKVVHTREYVSMCSALSRSKYFDGKLFGVLASSLTRAFKRREISLMDSLNILLSLSEINAYDAAMFTEACHYLRLNMDALPEPDQYRLEAALKRVHHDPGTEFFSKKKAKGDRREACPMFWRGQCKWGPRCKLSHDPENFEGTAKEGTWKPPSMSGGLSRGYKQSADLYKADKCGALW